MRPDALTPYARNGATPVGGTMSAETIDSLNFRALMRHMAAPVTIIASGAPGRRNGLTATAVCSVSDDPPTVLVCVNRAASAHDAIFVNGTFSINALAENQVHIARRFAGNSGEQAEARFSGDNWAVGVSGAPLLKDAVCSLECRITEHRAGATHSVFFAHVVAGSAVTGSIPLIYQRGAYLPLVAPSA